MFDLDSLLRTVGYAGVFAIVFVESGLLVGFFLPGDSLLFAAGFLASQGFFNIVILCILTAKNARHVSLKKSSITAYLAH